jgi:hypothetical protein
MAKVTIGGTEYEVPEMNFAALERAWPFVNEAMVSLDPMKGPAAGLCIIAAGLMEADHFDRTKFGMTAVEMLGEEQIFDRVVYFLKKKIKAKEIDGIRKSVDQINLEAGLEPAPGEALPLLAEVRQNLLAGTAPILSPSSSPPDVVEETGA